MRVGASLLQMKRLMVRRARRLGEHDRKPMRLAVREKLGELEAMANQRAFKRRRDVRVDDDPTAVIEAITLQFNRPIDRFELRSACRCGPACSRILKTAS